MVWYTLFTRTLTENQAGYTGTTIRQVIPVAAYDVGCPATGTQFRVTLQGGSVGILNTTKTYGGHGAALGDAGDFDGTQVAVLYSGSAATSTASGATLTSDEPAYTFDKTRPFVIGILPSFPSNFAALTDPVLFFQSIAGDFAATTDVAFTGSNPQIVFKKVEIFRADPAGQPTVTINKGSTQADPTSATAITFDVIFNKGVTGFTGSDVVLTASTTTGTLIATVTAGLDGGLGYTVSVTGMLTVGNVIATVPSGVCSAVDGAGTNVASTSTDNIVSWDPDIINPNTPNVHEVCIVDRNMLRIEIRDPPVTNGYTQVLGSPDAGTGTFAVTGAANNGHGQIRLTSATYAADLGGSGGYYITAMTASPVGNGIGGQKIRCVMYDTSLLTGSTISILHARGTIEANNTPDSGIWTFTVIDATHFDLNFAGHITAGLFVPDYPSAFVTAYTGGGVIIFGDQRRCTVHSVVGTTEANAAWVVSRSSTTTVDLTDTAFVNAYTSGGTIIAHGPIVDNSVTRANPSLSGANDLCHIVGRYGTTLRFGDISPAAYLDRTAAAVAANYTLSGGLTVAQVYRKSKPYSSGYVFSAGGAIPNAGYRHYLYLRLSGNLVSGTTYTLQFPSGAALPPKTFTFNDKVTRFAAIHVDQAGHRPADPGKLGYLSEWVPDHASHGEMDYSAITNWHIIDSGGTIVWSAGVAPAFRVGPTGQEGVSFDAPRHVKSTIKLVSDEGPAIKVTNITRASPGHVTVADATTLSNGQVITFSGLAHYGPGQSGPAGMWQAEQDGSVSNPGSNCFYDVTNLNALAKTFDLGCAKSVFSATVAAGGTGHAVNDRISLNNRVILQVATVGGGGVITSVTPVPNEAVADPPISGIPPYRSPASGFLAYPYTLPTNPQSEVSTTGGGTGATFNLTWADNPYDRNMLLGEGQYANPNTSAMDAFTHSTSGDTGNLLYKVNTFGNKGSTNVYGLDYAAATLTTGTYYVYIPNYGVSDPINISEGAWYHKAQAYLKGMYNERMGCTLDGRFGFTRTTPGFKSRAGFRIHKSLVSYVLSNYSNPGGPIGDINQNIGQGGGYDPWITTTEETAFGGHVDAGDWDIRIIETCASYWEVLDVWAHLPSAAQTSVSNMGTPTLLSCGLDPVIYAGTDSMPSPIAEVIWGLEPYRASQGVAGDVIGGINYGEGVPDAETSGIATQSIYSWYPDPVAALSYAFPAAKLAKVLGDLGYTSLAATYRASAIAAYDWSVSMYSDTAARDAWFLPVKTAARWTTAQYNSAMTLMLNQVPAKRGMAAASLFALTGTAAYDTFVRSYYSPVPGFIGEVFAEHGCWEYSNAAGANATFKADTRLNVVNACADSLNLYAQAPDVTYAGPISAGGWAMNFGAANNFIFTHHLVAGYLIHSDATDGVNFNPTLASLCLNSLQRWFGHRLGANQIGLCMTSGLGVRNNRETLHSDSKNSSQSLPDGLTSEGWANDYPSTPVVGFSFIKHVQQPHADPEIVASAARLAFYELYPTFMLAWPRWEYFLEISGAIEHSEFTTQQQMIPAFGGALFLHGFDGNTTVSGITTSTVLVSSLNPSGAGVSVDFTATVTPVSGGPVTGNVAFKDAGITIGTVAVNGSGVAVYTTSTLTPATHSIVAFYIGDGTYDSSTSNTISQVVTGSASSTALTSSLNPSVFGDSVTFTATVTGSGSPTGTVAFKDGGTTIGTGTLIAGVTTFATSLLAVGTHSMTGVYSGDGTFTTSTSNTVSQVVNSAAPPGPITLLPQACM